MNARLVRNNEDRALLAFLGLLFVLSIAIPILETATDWHIPASWNTPLVLAALYAILKLVGAVPEIRTDVRYLREVADVRVQRMATIRDYYDGLNSAVDQAASSLDLTHIRDTPPADFGEQASIFFGKLVDWSSIEAHSIRRIICVRTPAMHQWARQLADETANLTRFKVRVVNWSIDAPAMNMAIVDNKAVYLALTGVTPERTKGLGIEDEQAAQYFSDYYENLWRAGTDIEEWLQLDSTEYMN